MDSGSQLNQPVSDEDPAMKNSVVIEPSSSSAFVSPAVAARVSTVFRNFARFALTPIGAHDNAPQPPFSHRPFQQNGLHVGSSGEYSWYGSSCPSCNKENLGDSPSVADAVDSAINDEDPHSTDSLSMLASVISSIGPCSCPAPASADDRREESSYRPIRGGRDNTPPTRPPTPALPEENVASTNQPRPDRSPRKARAARTRCVVKVDRKMTGTRVAMRPVDHYRWDSDEEGDSTHTNGPSISSLY